MAGCVLLTVVGLAACTDQRALSLPLPSPPTSNQHCPGGPSRVIKLVAGPVSRLITVQIGTVVEATGPPGSSFPTSTAAALVPVCVRGSGTGDVTTYFRATSPGRAVIDSTSNVRCGPCAQVRLSAGVWVSQVSPPTPGSRPG